MRFIGWRFRLLVALAVLQVVFADRLALQINSGGRGVVSAMTLAFPLMVAAILLPHYRRALGFLRSGAFRWIWMPTILCALYLPLLGVAFQDYPLHSLFACWEGVLDLTFLAVGAWGASRPEGWGLARTALLISVVAQAMFAVIQASALIPGLAGWGAIQPLVNWDAQFKMAFSPDNLVLGRGTGFYLNPNALGVWSCLAFWASFIFLQGWRRTLGCAASIATLLVCLSRGSLFALVASVALYGLTRPWLGGSMRDRRKGAKRLVWGMGIAGLLGIGIAVLAAGVSQSADTSLLASMLDRFGAGVQVLSQGASADSNFLGRVQVWGEAWSFLFSHPFGTLGSPQLMLGLALDSEYMRVLLQGSFVFLFAYVAMLLGGISRLGSRNPCGRFIAVGSICLAINSISATPLAYPATGLFWIFVGAYLGRLPLDRASNLHEAA